MLPWERIDYDISGRICQRKFVCWAGNCACGLSAQSGIVAAIFCAISQVRTLRKMKILPYKSTQEGVEALERTLQAISPLVRVKRDEAGLYVISREGYVELDPVTSHMESYLMFAVMNQGYALDVTG